MSYVDLHVHSNASDGTLSPEQVVRLAHEAGLSAIALTDHDTTAGVAGAAEAGGRICPGLGLFVDTDSPSLQAALKEFRQHRVSHGIHLTAEDLQGEPLIRSSPGPIWQRGSGA